MYRQLYYDHQRLMTPHGTSCIEMGVVFFYIVWEWMCPISCEGRMIPAHTIHLVAVQQVVQLTPAELGLMGQLTWLGHDVKVAP